MRQAARATAAGMKAAVEEARIGVTENDIAAAVSDAIIRAGSESLTMSPIVTSGPRSAVAHTTFKRRPLENGDTVLLEWSGVYNQYSGPMMRSVVIGEPPKRLKEMWAVLVEALEAAIAAIPPGDHLRRGGRGQYVDHRKSGPLPVLPETVGLFGGDRLSAGLGRGPHH